MITQESLMQQFISSIKDMAALIIDENGVVAVSNDKANGMVGIELLGSSLSKMIKQINEPVLLSELLYCHHVEQCCLLSKENILSMEKFNGKMFIVLRTFISLNDARFVLVLLAETGLSLSMIGNCMFYI